MNNSDYCPTSQNIKEGNALGEKKASHKVICHVNLEQLHAFVARYEDTIFSEVRKLSWSHQKVQQQIKVQRYPLHHWYGGIA